MKSLTHLSRKDPTRHDKQGNGQHYDEGQFDTGNEHGEEKGDQRQTIGDHGNNAIGNHGIDGFGIINGPGGGLANRCLIEVLWMQPAKMIKDPGAQIADKVLTQMIGTVDEVVASEHTDHKNT